MVDVQNLFLTVRSSDVFSAEVSNAVICCKTVICELLRPP